MVQALGQAVCHPRIGLSSPSFPFLPRYGFPSFKYHFSVPRKKEDLEEDLFLLLFWNKITSTISVQLIDQNEVT